MEDGFGSNNPFRNRAKSEVIPHRTYLENDDYQQQRGLAFGNGGQQYNSTNPFLTPAELSGLSSGQSATNNFDYSPYLQTSFDQLGLNSNGASSRNGVNSKLRDIAEDAPELFIPESADGNAPELFAEAASEEGLLERYGLVNNQDLRPGGPGLIATSRESGGQVVVKKVAKSDQRKSEQVQREIAVLKAIAEDGTIATLEEWLMVDDFYYTVNTYRTGAPLAAVVQSQGPMPDHVAKSAINQLFSGIATIFMAGFAHLRICDETVSIDENQRILIRDFQYCCEYGKGKTDDLYAITSDKYGSDIYVAPEVFANNKYNARKAVIWSCGVLLYFMTTGQTEKLSNLQHPSFEGQTEVVEQPKPQSRRKASIAAAQASIIMYPNRFAAPNWARLIIPRMLLTEPTRRAELIEVATRVPKDYSEKATRPLMELAWLDYKTHVGPYAELDLDKLNESSASSIFSAASQLSNPFASLMNRGHSRRQSAPVNSRYAGYYG